MKTKIIASLLGLGMVAGMQGAIAEEYKWRYFGSVPMAHDVAKIIDAGFDRIAERTDGALEIEYLFFGETPYQPGEGPTLLRDGLVDLVEWLPAYSAGTYPMLTGPELPFAAAHYVSTAELHEQSRLSWENPAILTFEEGVLAEHDAVRVTRLFYEPMNMWFRGDISGYKDLADKRIRAISPEQAEFISAMGATPITIPGPELYSSLQRGLVDGVVIGASAVESFRLIEVIKTGYLMNLQLLTTGMLASRTSLDGLPEELRAVFLEEMAIVEAEARAFMVEQEARDIERFIAGGMTIVRPSEEDYQFMRQTAMDKVWTTWAARAGEGSQQFIDAVLQQAN